MAPEVYAGDHRHGTPFDWFCAGVTLHEFLTGRRPYEAVRLQKYYTNGGQNYDKLELDTLMKQNLTIQCIDFVSLLLHPDPTKRIGGVAYSMNGDGSVGGFQAIKNHPWLRASNLFDTSLIDEVKAELPHFKPNNESSNGFSKINVSRDEAVELVRQHQQHHVISDEVQEVFKK